MKLTTDELLSKIRLSNLLISTLLAYGFGFTVVGHILGSMYVIVYAAHLIDLYGARK